LSFGAQVKNILGKEFKLRNLPRCQWFIYAPELKRGSRDGNYCKSAAVNLIIN